MQEFITMIYVILLYCPNCQEIAEICDAAGIVLTYLPPYSLDLNPIEEVFAELKARLKKHRKLANALPTFDMYLKLGIENLKNNARGHFERTQIGTRLHGGEEADYWDD